jgi:hypothetical protein
LIAFCVCATRNPVVNALTIGWSAPESNPSSTPSTAAVEERSRESVRAVAIHSH